MNVGRQELPLLALQKEAASDKSGLSARAMERSMHGVWRTSLAAKKEFQHSGEPALKLRRFSSEGEEATQLEADVSRKQSKGSCQTRLEVDNVDSCQGELVVKGQANLRVLEDRWHSGHSVDREEGICITWARLAVNNVQDQAQQEHQCHN